jgi:hypothetical protein
MFRKGKRRKTYKYYRRSKRKKLNFWTRLGSKLLWVSITFLTILLFIYAFSFYRKLSQTEASEFGFHEGEERKPILARIQILNGCSDASVTKGEDLAQKIGKRLTQLKVDNISYEIMETEKCNFGSMGLEDSLVKESLIIDRIGNKRKDLPSEVALLTARALGISPQNVVYKKLKNNYQDISLTILIGNDFRILFPAVSR